MGLMMLAASNGSEIRVSVTGKDADRALCALQNLVESRFDEIE